MGLVGPYGAGSLRVRVPIDLCPYGVGGSPWSWVCMGQGSYRCQFLQGWWISMSQSLYRSGFFWGWWVPMTQGFYRSVSLCGWWVPMGLGAYRSGFL